MRSSSGIIELYLIEIRSGSLMFVVCLIGVGQRNFEPVLCVCVVRRAAARRTVHYLLLYETRYIVLLCLIKS